MDEWGRWAASPSVVERLEYWECARSPRRPVPEFDVSQLRPESVGIWLERGDGPAPLTDITQRFVVLRGWTDCLAFLLAYEIPESTRRLRAASYDLGTVGSPDDEARLRGEIWEALGLGLGDADEASVESIRDGFGRLFSAGDTTCRIVAWGTIEDILRSPEVYGRLRGAVAADEAEGDDWGSCLGLKFCTDNGWFDDSELCLEGAMEFFSREASSDLPRIPSEPPDWAIARARAKRTLAYVQLLLRAHRLDQAWRTVTHELVQPGEHEGLWPMVFRLADMIATEQGDAAAQAKWLEFEIAFEAGGYEDGPPG